MSPARKVVKYSIVEALCYLVLPSAILAAEKNVATTDALCLQLLPLAVFTTLLFALSVASYVLYARLVVRKSKALIGYYLGSKILTLLLAIGTLLVYAILHGGETLLLFALSLIALYVVHLVVSSLLYASVERNLKQNK